MKTLKPRPISKLVMIAALAATIPLPAHAQVSSTAYAEGAPTACADLEMSCKQAPGKDWVVRCVNGTEVSAYSDDFRSSCPDQAADFFQQVKLNESKSTADCLDQDGTDGMRCGANVAGYCKLGSCDFTNPLSNIYTYRNFKGADLTNISDTIEDVKRDDMVGYSNCNGSGCTDQSGNNSQKQPAEGSNPNITPAAYTTSAK